MTTMTMRLPRPARSVVGVALVGTMALQGCATVPVDEAGDTCVRFRQPLKQVVQQYNERIIGSAATSAATGALVGGLLTLAVTGDAGAALAAAAISGAAGGILGAANAYYDNKQSQAANNIELRTAIALDIQSSTGDVRTVSASVSRLNECRLDQLGEIRRAIQDGASKESQRGALADVRRRIGQDQDLISQVVGDVTTGSEVYAEAFARSRDVERTQVVARADDYQPSIDYIPRAAGGVVGSAAFAQQGANVRAGPGTEFNRIGAVIRGQRVGVVSGRPGSGWVEVNFRGQRGYIAGRLLGNNPPAAARRPSTGGTRTASLPVVDISARPRPTNETEELLLEAKDLEANAEAQAGFIEDELNSVDALLS